MAPPYENDFIPTTATEVALLDRIHELKRKLWEGGRHFNTWDGFPPDPNAVPIAVKDFNPTLRLAGMSEASLELPHGLRIRAKTEGPTAFGFGYYLDGRQLQMMKAGAEANMMLDLFRQAAESAGKLLRQQ